MRREFLEEIGQPLGEVRLLAVVENLFRVGGIDGHEVVFLFHATLEDPKAYDIADQGIRDHPTADVRVTWQRPGESGRRLVPEAITDFL